MPDFNIISQILLREPQNINQVSRNIQKKLELQPINLKVKDQASISRGLDGINSRLKQTRDNTRQATETMEAFGKQTAITIRRFGAYTLVTAGFFRFIGSISDGIKEAISFQDELIKIRQATGQSLFGLSALTDEIDRLSTSLGVSSKELLDASRILAQAGLTVNQTKIALEALAKSDLAPTFESINDTGESVIAMMSQFGLGADQVLDKLSSLNEVSAKFAVESGDLSTAIRKAGGSFQAAGGSLEELFALFTSVRSTTRESADSIATGFRTIFTRLQRVRTQNFLADLGIDLRNVGDEARRLGTEGLFVGPFEAIRRLSDALNELDSSDPKFAQIIEELGGFRQISKVIPLVQQFGKAEDALGVALRGTNSLTEDAIIRQESLAIQVKKVREEFLVLLRTIGDSEEFQLISRAVLGMATSFLKAADAISKLLPPLIALGSIAAIPGTLQFGSSLFKTLGSRTVVGFASGGKIPGSGNKDSVPIMAMPGEFVLRKEAVQKYGLDFVSALNEGRIKGFAEGGPITPVLNNRTGAGIAAASIGSFFIPSLLSALSKSVDGLNDFTGKLGFAGLEFLAFSTLLSNINPDISKFQETLSTQTDKLTEIQDKVTRARELKESVNIKKFDLVQSLGGDPSRFNSALNIIANRRSETRYRLENAPQSATEFRQLLETRLKNLDKIEKDINEKFLNPINQATNRITRAGNLEQSLKGRESLIKAEISATEKSILSANRFSVALAAATAGLGVVQGVLDDFAKSSLEELRSGSGNVSTARAQFVGSGGLSEAISNALTAAGLGFLTGGTKGGQIGAIGGAIFGGLTGFSQSMEQFDKELRSIDINKSIKELEDSLSALTSENTNFSIVAGSINGSIKDIARRLKEETDVDLRDSLNSAAEGSITSLLEFINKAKSSSSSLEEFSQAIDNSTLQFVADRTGKTLESYRREISRSIENIASFNRGMDRAILQQRQGELLLIAEKNLVSAIKQSEQAFNGFSLSLDAGLNLEDKVGKAFETLGSSSGSRRIINDFAKNFGSTGRTIASQVSDADRALQSLPSILLNLRKQDPFGQRGDFTNRFERAIDQLNLGSNVKNSLISSVSGIIGAEGKDSEILSRLTDDFTGVIEEIRGNVLKFGTAFTEISPIINSRLQDFANGLIEARGNLHKFAEANENIVEQQENFVDIIEKTFGKNQFDRRSELQQRRVNIFTRGQSSNQLLSNVQQGIRRESELRAALDTELETKRRRELIEQIVKEQNVIESSIIALRTLADSSKQTAVAQQRLEEATSNREVRKGLLQDLLLGGIDSRIGLRRTINQARTLERTGDINSVPDFDRENVVSLLSQLGKANLPQLGLRRSGEETLRRALEKALKTSGISARGILDPNQEELDLFSQIKKGFEEGRKIQEQLAQIEQDRTNKFITDLGKVFDRFISDQQVLLAKEAERDSRNRIASLQGDLNSRISLRQAGGRISSITGTDDPEVIIKNFKAIIENQKELNKNVNIASGKADTIDKILSFGQAGGISEFINTGGDPSEAIRLNKLVSDFGIDLSGKLGLDFDNITKKFEEELFKSSPQLAREFRSRIEGGSLAREEKALESDTFNPANFSIFASGVRNLINNIRDESRGNIENLLEERGRLSSNVGGNQIFANILSNQKKISEVIGKIPDGVDFTSLGKEIFDLQREISILKREIERSNNREEQRRNQQAPVRRNSGGIIPGFGNTDTVPARLTPGEFVIKKDAVNHYGLGLMRDINEQKFARGGLVSRLIGGFHDRRSKQYQDRKKKHEEFMTRYREKLSGRGREIGGLRFPLNTKLPEYKPSENDILAPIKNSILDSGVDVKFVNDVTEAFPDLRGKQPIGYKEGSTFEKDVRGLFKDNTIVVRGDAPEHILNHEYGHAFDKMLKYPSTSPAFNTAYQKDISRLSEKDKERFSYLIQNGSENGRREAFASIFASIAGTKDRKIPSSQSFFNSTLFVRRLVFDSLLETGGKFLPFNTGGIVPGYGNTDTVPARLTPGEYVINKDSVNKYGVGFVKSINDGSFDNKAVKFNNGGLVGVNTSSTIRRNNISNNQTQMPAMDMSGINKLSAALSQFSMNVDKITQAISSIPSEITMRGTHRVEVVINGAQVLTSITPSIKNLVESEISVAINRMLKNKFPEVGPY